jgi:glycosyltransferase involved in cell wall biosynthesis
MANSKSRMGSLSLAVIFPTRNNSEQIRDHLIHAKSWIDLASEIIVVDSSIDDTLEICRSLLPAHTKIIQHPPGLYASWNSAVKAISSEYVYISTVGDTIKANFLEKLLVYAEAHRLDLVISPPEFIEAKPNYRWPIHKLIERFGTCGQHVLEGEDVALINYWSLSECGLGSLSGSFASNVARADLLKAHPFPTDYAGFGDVMWFAQVCGQIRLGIIPDVGSSFLCHESNHQKLPEAHLYRCWTEAIDIVAGQLGTKITALKKASHDFQDHKMKFKKFKRENPGLLKEPFKKIVKSLKKKILRRVLARELRAFNNQFISALNNSESRCNHSHKLDVFTE